MSKIKPNRVSACNVICAILMVLLLILQFSPFWHFGDNDEREVSLIGYIWLPTHNTDVEDYLQEALGNEAFTVTDIVAMSAVTLFTGCAGIFFCLWKSGYILSTVLPAAVGITGIWGYLSHEAFRLGYNWQLHLIVCIAIAGVAVFSIVTELIKMVKKSKS